MSFNSLFLIILLNFLKTGLPKSVYIFGGIYYEISASKVVFISG